MLALPGVILLPFYKGLFYLIYNIFCVILRHFYANEDTVATIKAELSRPGVRAWLGSTTELHVEKLDVVRCWRDHWKSQGIGLEGGLLEDSTGNHVFLMMQNKGIRNMAFFWGSDWVFWLSKWMATSMFIMPLQKLNIELGVHYWKRYDMTKTNFLASQPIYILMVYGASQLTHLPKLLIHPWDLPEQLANGTNRGSWCGGVLPGDVVCLLKRHISDGELSQPPLLVLPQSRVFNVQSMVCTEKYLGPREK